MDGKFVLWESPAVLFHLARTGGGRLWPEEPNAQADVLRWMSFGAGHIDPYLPYLTHADRGALVQGHGR